MYTFKNNVIDTFAEGMQYWALVTKLQVQFYGKIDLFSQNWI